MHFARPVVVAGSGTVSNQIGSASSNSAVDSRVTVSVAHEYIL